MSKLRFDNIELNEVNVEQGYIKTKLNELNKSFPTKIKSQDGYYGEINSSIDNNIARFLNESDLSALATNRASNLDMIKHMFSGTKLENGKSTLGLNEISSWKVNKYYKYANRKQHAGYAAEVISTTKENMLAKAKNTGITTYRTDDIPEKYGKNNQYIDKVRIDSKGNVVERIQTKFVGKNSSECLSKLASKKCSKYLNDGQVDKIEIPRDFYDKIKKELIPDKISKLENQIKRNVELGKEDIVAKKTVELEKYKKIDSMIEKSLVSNKEAEFSIKHNKIYSAKLFSTGTVRECHNMGKFDAKSAAMITAGISTVDNISKAYKGEIEIEDAVANIVYDTGAATVLGYGTGFVSGVVSSAMKNSSHQFIKSVGGSCLPAAAVSLAVESYDIVSEYSMGKIDEYELVEGLGDNLSKVSGGIAGAQVGMAVGTVIPVAGNVIGGVIGGMVGCAIASEAYQSTVEYLKENTDEIVENIEEFAEDAIESGEVLAEAIVNTGENIVEVVSDNAQELAQNVVEGVEELAEQAQQLAANTMDLVKDVMPDKLPDVKAAFNDFASKCKIPF